MGSVSRIARKVAQAVDPAAGTVTLAAVTLAAALSAALFSDVAAAEPEDALLPVPGLFRPAPQHASEEGGGKVYGGCADQPLPLASTRMPYGPGEHLGYDVSLLGFRTGRITVRVGERTEVDGAAVYPSYATAKTTGFLSMLGELDGKMVSWLDPDTAKPVRMVNRFVVDTITAPPLLAREDAAFSTDAQVAARLLYKQGDHESTKPAKLRSTSDLLDVLSVIYYMRSRRLEPGDAFCFEIYHRRRLWRVEGAVEGTELVTAPFTTRRARRVKGTLALLGGGKHQPRPIDAWVSDDDDRLPLLVRTPDRMGTLEVKLAAFSPGRRLVRTASR